MKKVKNNPVFRLSYQDRLRGYEADKKNLLVTHAGLSGAEFAEKLKLLQDKWRI